MHNSIVIADTSCLIVLTHIDSLHILNHLYKNIYITPEIVQEFGEDIPEFIKVIESKQENVKEVLSLNLDVGESSAIALALTINDALLILDDLKARKQALKLGLKITGTLAIIVKASELGLIINLNESLLILKNKGFRISDKILGQLL